MTDQPPPSSAAATKNNNKKKSLSTYVFTHGMASQNDKKYIYNQDEKVSKKKKKIQNSTCSACGRKLHTANAEINNKRNSKKIHTFALIRKSQQNPAIKRSLTGYAAVAKRVITQCAEIHLQNYNEKRTSENLQKNKKKENKYKIKKKLQ